MTETIGLIIAAFAAGTLFGMFIVCALSVSREDDRNGKQ